LKRYEAMADEIGQSIREGLLRPGDRLPSVRQASAHRRVSPSTVFQAYYLLEARGLIRSRERSGYFVTANASPLPPEPDRTSRPSGDSTDVDVSDRIFGVLESAMSREVVPLGSAFPSPLLFPLPRLARAMAASVQKLDPWASVDDLTPGNARLRRQIALRYLIDGVHVPAEEIVITNGAMEALNLCLTAVTRP
jgi:DNA-binding transcriptional MocR family regulator